MGQNGSHITEQEKAAYMQRGSRNRSSAWSLPSNQNRSFSTGSARANNTEGSHESDTSFQYSYGHKMQTTAANKSFDGNIWRRDAGPYYCEPSQNIRPGPRSVDQYLSSSGRQSARYVGDRSYAASSSGAYRPSRKSLRHDRTNKGLDSSKDQWSDIASDVAAYRPSVSASHWLGQSRRNQEPTMMAALNCTAPDNILVEEGQANTSHPYRKSGRRQQQHYSGAVGESRSAVDAPCYKPPLQSSSEVSAMAFNSNYEPASHDGRRGIKHSISAHSPFLKPNQPVKQPSRKDKGKQKSTSFVASGSAGATRKGRGGLTDSICSSNDYSVVDDELPSDPFTAPLASQQQAVRSKRHGDKSKDKRSFFSSSKDKSHLSNNCEMLSSTITNNNTHDDSITFDMVMPPSPIKNAPVSVQRGNSLAGQSTSVNDFNAKATSSTSSNNSTPSTPGQQQPLLHQQPMNSSVNTSSSTNSAIEMGSEECHQMLIESLRSELDHERSLHNLSNKKIEELESANKRKTEQLQKLQTTFASTYGYNLKCSSMPETSMAESENKKLYAELERVQADLQKLQIENSSVSQRASQQNVQFESTLKSVAHKMQEQLEKQRSWQHEKLKMSKKLMDLQLQNQLLRTVIDSGQAVIAQGRENTQLNSQSFQSIDQPPKHTASTGVRLRRKISHSQKIGKYRQSMGSDPTLDSSALLATTESVGSLTSFAENYSSIVSGTNESQFGCLSVAASNSEAEIVELDSMSMEAGGEGLCSNRASFAFPPIDTTLLAPHDIVDGDRTPTPTGMSQFSSKESFRGSPTVGNSAAITAFRMLLPPWNNPKDDASRTVASRLNQGSSKESSGSKSPNPIPNGSVPSCTSSSTSSSISEFHRILSSVQGPRVIRSTSESNSTDSADLQSDFDDDEVRNFSVELPPLRRQNVPCSTKTTPTPCVSVAPRIIKNDKPIGSDSSSTTATPTNTTSERIPPPVPPRLTTIRPTAVTHPFSVQSQTTTTTGTSIQPSLQSTVALNQQLIVQKVLIEDKAFPVSVLDHLKYGIINKKIDSCYNTDISSITSTCEKYKAEFDAKNSNICVNTSSSDESGISSSIDNRNCNFSNIEPKKSMTSSVIINTMSISNQSRNLLFPEAPTDSALSGCEPAWQCVNGSIYSVNSSVMDYGMDVGGPAAAANEAMLFDAELLFEKASIGRKRTLGSTHHGRRLTISDSCLTRITPCWAEHRSQSLPPTIRFHFTEPEFQNEAVVVCDKQSQHLVVVPTVEYAKPVLVQSVRNSPSPVDSGHQAWWRSKRIGCSSASSSMTEDSDDDGLLMLDEWRRQLKVRKKTGAKRVNQSLRAVRSNVCPRKTRCDDVGVVRYTPPGCRASVIRPSVFQRYGFQERVALEAFDFLDSLSGSSSPAELHTLKSKPFPKSILRPRRKLESLFTKQRVGRLDSRKSRSVSSIVDAVMRELSPKIEDKPKLSSAVAKSLCSSCSSIVSSSYGFRETINNDGESSSASSSLFLSDFCSAGRADNSFSSSSSASFHYAS